MRRVYMTMEITMMAIHRFVERFGYEVVHTGIVFGLSWWATMSIPVALVVALAESAVRHALAEGCSKEGSRDCDISGSGRKPEDPWIPPPEVPW